MRTRMRNWTLAAVSLSMAASLTACNGGDDSSQSKGKDDASTSQAASPLHVITAAAKKTDGAKSAKVSMTITSPEQPGKMTMQGAMSWDPLAMDMTMSGVRSMGGSAGGPQKVRMLWVNNVMYMDMGSSAAAQQDGKKWMAIDFAALAKASGDKALAEKMTSQLQNTQQTPAQQMGMMLASPDIKFVGEEKVDGVSAKHYKGSLTMKEMLQKNKNLGTLDTEQRQKLVDNMKKQGITGADLDVWVNSDALPVRIDVAMDSKKGATEVSEHISDYGVTVSPKAPPADETFDLGKMLAEIGKSGGAGA